MADDLDDEWWLQGKERAVDSDTCMYLDFCFVVDLCGFLLCVTVGRVLWAILYRFVHWNTCSTWTWSDSTVPVRQYSDIAPQNSIQARIQDFLKGGGG